ncbi:MAG TPA: hypothetical protein VLU25_16260 [Acidobacteriota bacterium]|nr:hypothetical protein [Acidobacteriota bacterium]
MSSIPPSIKRVLWLSLAAALSVALSAVLWTHKADAKEKMEPEELIQRHLNSIGEESAVRQRNNIWAEGTGRLEIVSPGEGTAEGVVQLVSRDGDLRYSFAVARADYNGEGAVVEDGKVTVAYATPGERSFLGEFLFSQKVVLQEGLFGGVLSAAWPLADDLEARKNAPKLKYQGSKKFGNTKAHVLRYEPRRTSVKITLYFDEENFTHLGTEYELRVPAPPSATPTDTARLRDSRIHVIEYFSDFKEVDGFYLPTQWKVEHNLFGNGPGTLWQWIHRFERIVHGAELPANAFAISE